MANMSTCTSDLLQIPEIVTKLNKEKKKRYYEAKVNDIKYDGMKLWAERGIQLHLSLNHLMFPIISIIISLTK